MSKVYLYHQKIFKYVGIVAFVFGVTSCASTQTTAATSGETDGVYYSPSRDGKVESMASVESQSSDIKVGSPYFDAEGNGAEEFYYEVGNSGEAKTNVNIYTGASNVFVTSGASTDWGRFDGVDITVNNFGWYDPWWGWGYNSWYWGFPRYRGWYGSYYGYFGWGWGSYYYHPYWSWGPGYYSPYWGWGGYYGYPYGYYYPGYYYRATAVRPGTHPGSTLAFGQNYRSNFRTGTTLTNPSRMTRTGSTLGTSDVRPVRQTVQTDSNFRTNNGNVRENTNVRVNQPSTTNNSVRPVRATRTNEVRTNSNSNGTIRTNTTPRTNSNGNVNQRTRSTNSNIRTNSNSQPTRSNSSTPSMRSSSSSPSMGSGSSGGGVRSGGGTRR